MLQLKSPLKKWDFLENRFGWVPRPNSWLVVEEAMQQDAAEETAHPYGNSDNEPENLPEGSSEALEPQEDPAESPDDCTETKSGYLTPETKVVERKNMEPNPLVVEVGGAELELSDEHEDMGKAPDEGGQCASDEVKESWDLPEPSSKALELKCDATRPAGSHLKSGLLLSFEEDQCTQMHSDEPILEIPDPPSTHTECPVPRVESPTLQNDPEETGSTLEDPKCFTSDTPPNKVWGMGVPGTPREGLGDSTDTESKMMKLEIRGISAKMAGMQNALPRPPEPPPNGPTRTSSTFSNPRRCGRLKAKAENVVNVHCNEVRSTREAQTRGYLYPSENWTSPGVTVDCEA
ncbi:hypothetical protein EDD15DRAFT_2192609 [Pisolithus albus]|nr:hypothetical protein EDD15DRAFT_2192609 [Pisolithus albus]